MPYLTGTATGHLDLLNQLATFATANGWTENGRDFTFDRWLALSRGSCFVQFASDPTNGAIAMYQSLGYTAGRLPGLHPDDSGSGLPMTAAQLAGATIVNGGSGYTSGTNRVFNVLGGTFTTQATITATVTGGVVTAITNVGGGNYTVRPTNAVATSPQAGGGTGFTANLNFRPPLTSQRRMNIPDTPIVRFHFFANDNDLTGGVSTSAPHIHVVIEYAAGQYRHMSFGSIAKIGDWTGGEYACTSFWTPGSVADSPTAPSHLLLWDALHGSLDGITNNRSYNTMHMRNIGNQLAAERWGVFGTGTTTDSPDTAGNARRFLSGGMRYSWHLASFGKLRGNPLNAFVPLIPIPIAWRRTTGTPQDMIFLGNAPNVRHVQMASFNPSEQITVGSDQWLIFPGARKQRLLLDTEESWNMGIAYLRTP